jgi:protein PhnA
MSLQTDLENRASHKCELCESTDLLTSISLKEDNNLEHSVCVCHKCKEAIDSKDYSDHNHFRCLNNSMWSEHSPVKVLTYRILDSLSSETWATDLLEQIYLDENELEWAKEGIAEKSYGAVIKDSNGAILSEGDSVTLIKDLVVKGAIFTAKRGTMVRNISLTEDPKYIEGKVNGSHIVIIADFVKKQ